MSEADRPGRSLASLPSQGHCLCPESWAKAHLFYLAPEAPPNAPQTANLTPHGSPQSTVDGPPARNACLILPAHLNVTAVQGHSGALPGGWHQNKTPCYVPGSRQGIEESGKYQAGVRGEECEEGRGRKRHGILKTQPTSFSLVIPPMCPTFLPPQALVPVPCALLPPC